MLNQEKLSEKPSSHLGLAVIATLFCCLPLGIVGLIQAAGVDDAWSRGDKELAYEKSEKAQLWINWAMVIGAIGIVLYIILFFIYGVALYNVANSL